MRPGWTAVVAAAAFSVTGCDGGGSETNGSKSGPQATTQVALPEVAEPPPSTKQLVGTWSRTGSSTLFRFNPDGTFDVDTHTLDVPLYATGEYQLDGATIAFSTSGPECNDVWEWDAGIVTAQDRADDELHIVFLESGCGIPAGAEWTLARL
jgi:hypothetical protein